jgi:CheY-like chemotaxis protein
MMDAILRANQRQIHRTVPPAVVDESAAPEEAAEPPVDRAIVLIVDDDPDVGIILQHLLRPYAADYDVRSVSDPTDALRSITGERISFVITDFNMPGMNGLHIAAAVKRYSPDTPVLLITAYTTSVLEQLARQHLVDYYITKPFRLSALEQVIAAVLTSQP